MRESAMDRSGSDDERLIAYKKALISVMSDGVITPVEEDMLLHLRRLLSISDEDAERIYHEIVTKEGIESPVRVDTYREVLRQVIEDTVISEDEQRVLSALRRKLGISEELHETLLQSLIKEAEISAVKEKESIRDVLVIYHDGRLITHIPRGKEECIAPDSDLVAGMLAAIQSFMDDVYSGVATGDIEEVKYGDRFFIIETGKYISIAVSSRERLSEYTRRKIRDFLRCLESGFEVTLKQWDGNMNSMAEVIARIREEFRSGDKGSNG